MAVFDPVAYINEPRWQQSRLGLHRMRALLRAMGDPQDALRFIHVAGTNGKGSVCSYLSAVLQEAGYRTGLFTSPYVVEFAERIRVNGVNIDDSALLEATLFVRDHAERLAEDMGEHPTEFELMCAVALEHFKRSRCDIVVMEVGLGGRLDATNVIPAPEVAVIARIGFDHTALLGDVLPQIAREKAGIVKPGASVVGWPQEDACAMAEIRKAAELAGCPLVVADFEELQIGGVGSDGYRRFSYRGAEYRTRLLGSYQPCNAAVALEALSALEARGFVLGDAARKKGIAAAIWPGRFQLISADPVPFVVDGGHNPQGAAALAESLCDVFADRKVVFIMGVLADKDCVPMIREVLPLARSFVCVAPPNPRALAPDELALKVRELFDGEVRIAQLEEALPCAYDLAGEDDVICAFGSLYSLAAFIPRS